MPRILFLALASLMLPLAAAEAGGQVAPVFATAAFSPDGKWLATSEGRLDLPGGEVKVLDVATGKERLVCTGHADVVFAVAFSPDGKTLASGDWKGVVKTWDTATGKELATFRGHPGYVRSVAFSPDGKLLAAGSPGLVLLWDAATCKERATFREDVGYCVVFSPDGKTLASGGENGVVMLWAAATGKQRAVLEGHTSVVLAAVFAPDGKTVATAGADTTIRLWDVARGRPTGTLQGYKSAVFSLAYSPDGRMLASACCWHEMNKSSAKGKANQWVCRSEVKVWEAATHKERLAFRLGAIDASHLPMCVPQFTGNGKTLMTVRPLGPVQRWNLAELAIGQPELDPMDWCPGGTLP
jgi:WD40 repeat protein